MSFTLRTNNENGGSSGATTVAVNLTSIGSGDLIIVATAGDSATTMTVSDGTSSLTGLSINSLTNKRLQIFYLLSSVATGTVTYTTTYSASTVTREIHAWSYTHAGTPSLDQELATGQNNASTAMASGNITTTGTDELVLGVGYFSAGQIPSSMQINGSAADNSVAPSGGHMATWAKAFASTFTGEAVGTLTSTTWQCNIVSFKIAAAGRTTKNSRAFPLGMEVGMNIVGNFGG